MIRNLIVGRQAFALCIKSLRTCFHVKALYLSQWQKLRTELYFEDIKDARARTKKRKEKEENGTIKPKRHCTARELENVDVKPLVEDVKKIEKGDWVSTCNKYFTSDPACIPGSRLFAIVALV